MLIFKICPTNAHCRSNDPFIYIIQEYVKKNWLLTPLGSATFQNPKWPHKAFSEKNVFFHLLEFMVIFGIILFRMLRWTEKCRICENRPLCSAFMASQRNPRWPPFCHKTAFIFPYVHKFHILMQNEILLKKRGLKMCHTCMFASQNTDLLQKYCKMAAILDFFGRP